MASRADNKPGVLPRKFVRYLMYVILDVIILLLKCALWQKKSLVNILMIPFLFVQVTFFFE